ncbi:MAG: hypothetical protein ACP5OP_06955 [Leptospirillia bacterium]
MAFGGSLDSFERILRQMAGTEDGIRDALFTFSTLITGSYDWCPPVSGRALILSLP